MSAESQAWDINGPERELEAEKVQCKYCGAIARHKATRQCDNCWEVASRVKYMTHQNLHNILVNVKPDFLRLVIKGGRGPKG